MQNNYIGNSLLGDELAIAQQLISDILTCFGANVLDRATLAAEAVLKVPNRGPMGDYKGKIAPIGRQEVHYRGAP